MSNKELSVVLGMGALAIFVTCLCIGCPLGLAVLAGAMSLAVFAATPRLLVPLVILAAPVTRICLSHERASGWVDRIYLSHAFLLLFLVLWLLKALKDKGLKDRLPTEMAPLIVLFCLGSATWFLLPQEGWALLRVGEFVAVFVALLGTQSLVMGKKGLSLLFGTWFLCGVYVAVTNAVSLALDPYVSEYPLGSQMTLDVMFGTEAVRAGGVGIHNGTALILNMSIFMTLAGIFYAGKPRYWVLALPFIFAMFFGQLITRSRGAFYGLLVGLCLAALWMLRSRRSVLLGVALMVSLCLGSFFVSHIGVEHSALNRLMSPVVSYTRQAGFSFRIKVWSRALDELSRLNWLGMGLGGWAVRAPDLPHGHSVFFTPVFEWGPLGVLLWPFFLFLAVRGTWIRWRKCRGTRGEHAATCLMAGLVAVALQGIASFDYTHLPFWIFLGCGWYAMERWAAEKRIL